MNYFITDKLSVPDLQLGVNEELEKQRQIAKERQNSWSDLDCMFLSDIANETKLDKLAIVIDDEVHYLVGIVRFLDKNSLIKNVICMKNIETFNRIIHKIKSPIFASIDFDLGNPAAMYNDTSKVYLKVKELYPLVPVVGYTNFEKSGDPVRSPDAKKLIELFNKKGDSVFDKTNIKDESAFNNIVRDKLRIAKLSAEKDKLSKENQRLANDNKQLKVETSIMKTGIQAEEDVYIKRGAENPLFQEIPLIGKSEAMMRIKFHVEKQSNIDNERPILLLGETGTGKDMVALALHRLSKKRCHKEFVHVNCKTNSGDLFESAFFGHEKGSFTGAEKLKKGFFEQAHEGVLFLNEIAELSLENQTKLLTVIENKKIRRVGGEVEIKVDVKIIAATKEDLLERVRMGLFREDLYFRIRSIFPKMPNLEERKEDIPLLINYFIKETKKQFSSDAIDFISTKLDYKGNIRDLKQIIQDVSDFTSEQIIQVADVRYVIETMPGINYKIEDENNSNPNAQYVLNEIYRIVSENMVNNSITDEFIAKRFKTNSSKPQTGISRQVFRNNYWDKNKDEIIGLIKKDLSKYKPIIIERCAFIRNELKRNIS